MNLSRKKTMNSNESEDWEGFSKNGSWENSIKSERWVVNFSESDAKDSSSKSQSWENWIDVWAGFWLEGVALPIVAIFGIIGEKHYWLNKPAKCAISNNFHLQLTKS